MGVGDVKDVVDPEAPRPILYVSVRTRFEEHVCRGVLFGKDYVSMRDLRTSDSSTGFEKRYRKS